MHIYCYTHVVYCLHLCCTVYSSLIFRLTKPHISVCTLPQVDGTAIGFMSITDDINFSLLNECFELGPVHGLRKPHDDDVTTREVTPVPSPAPAKGERHPDHCS